MYSMGNVDIFFCIEDGMLFSIDRYRAVIWKRYAIITKDLLVLLLSFFFAVHHFEKSHNLYFFHNWKHIFERVAVDQHPKENR